MWNLHRPRLPAKSGPAKATSPATTWPLCTCGRSMSGLACMQSRMFTASSEMQRLAVRFNTPPRHARPEQVRTTQPPFRKCPIRSYMPVLESQIGKTHPTKGRKCVCQFLTSPSLATPLSSANRGGAPLWLASQRNGTGKHVMTKHARQARPVSEDLRLAQMSNPPRGTRRAQCNGMLALRLPGSRPTSSQEQIKRGGCPADHSERL